MELEVTCPGCGKQFYVEHDGKGGVVHCPFCNAALEIGELPMEATPSHPTRRPATLRHPPSHANLHIPHKTLPATEPPKPSASMVEMVLWLLLVGAGIGFGWWWLKNRPQSTETTPAAASAATQVAQARPPPPPPSAAPSPKPKVETPPPLRVETPLPPPLPPPLPAQQAAQQEMAPATPPAEARPPAPPQQQEMTPPQAPPQQEMAPPSPPAQQEVTPPEEQPPAAKLKEPVEVQLLSPGFDTSLDGWNILQTAGLVLPRTDAAHSGQRGLRVTDQSGERGTIVAYPFAGKPGDKFQCSFWARIVSGSGATVGFRFTNAQGQSTTQIVEIPAGTKDWKEFTVSATVPDLTKECEICIATTEAGKVVADFDDFQLRQIP